METEMRMMYAMGILCARISLFRDYLIFYGMGSSIYKNYIALKADFSKAFWVANMLELLERLAFYGGVGILTVFLGERLGLEDPSSITGYFTGMIYLLPILAGVVVDRYGFKKTLLVCFLIFSIGYGLVGLAGFEVWQSLFFWVDKKTYIIVVLTFTAVGGSLIKPCITGVVEHSVSKRQKSIGFSVYYTLVNLGGALGPSLGLVVRGNWGMEYVLIMSSLLSMIIFGATWLFFEEPEVKHQADARALSTVLTDMLKLFLNFQFIVFLVIFSGFWIMFWQIYLLIPHYAREVLQYENFEILETVDAWAIIVLTIPLAVLARSVRPSTAITIGFLLASCSWIIIGLVGTVVSAFVALVIFAIGEAFQAPRFYEFVGSLAPRNRVGTFLGFSFIPIALGSFIGGPLADYLRTRYFDTNPTLMWMIVASIGLISTVLMIIYNRIILKK